jgi:putative ABC transport system permease protein
MKHILSDVRFTLRLLRRGPAFFATLLAVLVAGIGATTAMFSIVHSLLLEPLPFAHPERLTMIHSTQPLVDPSAVSIPDFNDWRSQATTFDGMAATNNDSFNLSSEGAKPEFLAGANVSGDFFSLFGKAPLLGRLFGPDDDRVGAPRVAVIGASLWHRRFGSDPTIIGRTITLNGEPHTVVGVAAEGFRFCGRGSSGGEVWTPLAVTYSNYAKAAASQRGSHFLGVVGRRKAGVSLEEAQAQLASIAKSISIAAPDSNSKTGVRAVDLHDELVGDSRGGVWVLFAAVALVFLIVCANVANLLLTRAQTRRGELAARAALGATSSRLAAQIVTETIVIFLLGSLGGALLSNWLVGLFASGIVNSVAKSAIDVRVDGVALLFSIGACLVCGVLCGLLPAFAVSRVEPQIVLKESAARAGVSRSQRTVRSALVVAQVAVAFALLVGSALALEAFAKVAAVSPGFDASDLASARVTLPQGKYADEAKAAAFYRDVLARIAAQPGVESVAANSALPMANSSESSSFEIEGRPPWPDGEGPNLERNSITPGYFATMRIPLLRGRDFTGADRHDGRPVMILSQSAAERLFPGEDAVGHRISWGDYSADPKTLIWLEIVGVVGDVRSRGLPFPVEMECYMPLDQRPNRWVAIVARSPRGAALLQELPGLVEAVDPEQAVQSQMLMTDRVSGTVGSRRYVALLLTAFAVAALFLATLGIFGLMSYSTSQRTRELGIRMALGSTPEAAVALVIKGGLRLLGAGLGLGLLCALLVGRILASRIPGVAAFDLATYAVIPAILGLAGLIACVIPAWRAVRIPPASALRYD